ncbi:hypothetical protein BRC60_03855 [Halobacteriales archaeon QH_1_68_42]|nr:MAG: hypothetical protein BRC60_03855 [Halobacteriales archaeon QH_1_68_42]
MVEPSVASDEGGGHAAAAAAFARRVRERKDLELASLILFGSTARGDASGLGSDVDFLAVVPDDADRPAIEDELRDVAYDVMLEFGPVVEVHVLSRSTFERQRDHPFVRRPVREGETYDSRTGWHGQTAGSVRSLAVSSTASEDIRRMRPSHATSRPPRRACETSASHCSSCSTTADPRFSGANASIRTTYSGVATR